MFGSEKRDASTYLDIKLTQSIYFSSSINQNSYISCISEIALSKKMKDKNSALTSEKKNIQKCHRSVKLGCRCITTRY